MRYLLVLGLAVLFLVSPVVAASGALDGSVFTVSMAEQGGEAQADTLTFADGTFHSSACDQYGFAAAAYETTDADGAISFEATATSATEGENRWTGTVSGDAIRGTLVWSKAGQDPITYEFSGTRAGE